MYCMLRPKVLQQQKIRDGTSFVIKLGDKNVAGHNWHNRRNLFFSLQWLRWVLPYANSQRFQVAYDDKSGPDL